MVICHNNLHDITAELLSTVYNDVAIEPPLQPLSGEVFTPGSANQQDDAKDDIHACGFWGGESAFFDIRVFHQMYRATTMHQCHLSRDITRCRRRGSMGTEFEKWS